MSKKDEAYLEARSLLLSEYHSILSTHSVDMEGYPFASVAPYCLDRSGCPIILISSIAQHTKNIVENPKVSMIITEREVDDIQTGARLTLLALANPVDDSEVEDLANRYYHYFPEAIDYHKTHDFNFYRLDVQRARFIGGFGKIHWLERDALLFANPFDLNAEDGIINHMNEDHADAIAKYADQAGYKLDNPPKMVGIDAEGIHLLSGRKVVRVNFARKISNAKEAREILVEMARAS